MHYLIRLCSLFFLDTVYYVDVTLIGYLENNVIDVHNIEYIDNVRACSLDVFVCIFKSQEVPYI